MVFNNNSALTKELIDGGRLQVVNGVPQTINNNIQPVMEVNPKLLKVVNKTAVSTSTATSATIYTTPANQDFYLTFASLSVIKDVGNLSTSETIRVRIDGATSTILSIASISGTAQTQQTQLNFSPPIKCDKSSVIDLIATDATAVIRLVGIIGGYIVDNSNA